MAKYLSDLLSAASLLLTVAGILFGLWYPNITEALATEVKKYKADNVRACKVVSNVLWSRALPLTLIAVPLGLIFLPDAISVTAETLACLRFGSAGHRCRYDAIGTAFCLVVVASLALGLNTARLSMKLLAHRLRLGQGSS